MQNKKIIVIVVIGLVIASLSFWGGVKYESSKKSPSQLGGNFNQNCFMGNQNNNGRTTGMRNNAGGGLVSGEIISKDDKSITIKLRDGGSKIVLLSSSTKVEKTVSGNADDMIVGKDIVITGTTNTDGSVNATSVQIRSDIPMMQNKIN